MWPRRERRENVPTTAVDQPTWLAATVCVCVCGKAVKKQPATL